MKPSLLLLVLYLAALLAMWGFLCMTIQQKHPEVFFKKTFFRGGIFGSLYQDKHMLLFASSNDNTWFARR